MYVTGLTHSVREDELLKTLRKPEFFGQYGNIQKISISNRKSADGQNQSLGVYVTFETKEEAQRCIQAVNGSINDGRVLKAQLGTTKYCSAWLRYEPCTNRQCMFLHELGDEEDSYTRQDLSSMNSIGTQRPLGAGSSSRGGQRQQPQPQPAQQAQASSSSQPMGRTSSRDGSENGDGSALPSSANWARATQQRSRRGSYATSGAASSPAVSTSVPVTAEPVPEEAVEQSPVREEAPTMPTVPESSAAGQESSPSKAATKKKAPVSELVRLLTKWELRWPALSPELQAEADRYPPLFDIHGGARRQHLKRDAEAERLRAEQVDQSDASVPLDVEPESGSLALGGEPEDREPGRDVHGFDARRHAATMPPIQRDAVYSPVSSQSVAAVGSIGGGRTLTPQQQQQLYGRPHSAFADQMPPGLSPTQSSLFQQQAHARQASRYGMAVDGGVAGVKLAQNARIMGQQGLMASSFHGQPGSQYYSASMAGPPPGLKSTGTPPNLFGQGHGFGAAAFGGGAKESPSELIQNMMRRGGVNSQAAHETGKREYLFSYSNEYPPSTSSSPAPAMSSFMAPPYGAPAQQPSQQWAKRRGKKHRHANTSSSGGSGVVDLADPSILQARMQQQAQGNVGAGQALFAGQSQGGYNNPSMMYNNSGYGSRW